MKEFLEKIRKPKTGIPLKRQLAATVGIILLGVALGVLQKWLDATAANTLPLLLQRMDIGNYFGRLAIWFLLGTAVSVYSASPPAGRHQYLLLFYQHGGGVLSLLPLRFGLPAPLLYDDMGSDVLRFVLPGDGLLVCQRGGCSGGAAIRRYFRRPAGAGGQLEDRPGVLCLPPDGGLYMACRCAASAQKGKGICGGDGAVRCGGGLVSAHPAALGMTPKTNKNPTEESPAGSFFGQVNRSPQSCGMGTGRSLESWR